MTTPTARARIIAFLEQHGPMDSRAIADHCYTVKRNAQIIIRTLRDEGLVYIASWDRYGDGASGTMIPRYALGHKKDAPRPARLDGTQVQRNRRERLRAQYGRSIAYRILASSNKGGFNHIVLDGKTVYKRGKVRNPYGRNANKPATTEAQP